LSDQRRERNGGEFISGFVEIFHRGSKSHSLIRIKKMATYYKTTLTRKKIKLLHSSLNFKKKEERYVLK